MIPEHSIESKDFSIELPQVIQKVAFICDLLSGGYTADGNEFEPLLDEHTGGVSCILHDIEVDLKIINEALYGTKDTAKQGAESTE